MLFVFFCSSVFMNLRRRKFSSKNRHPASNKHTVNITIHMKIKSLFIYIYLFVFFCSQCFIFFWLVAVISIIVMVTLLVCVSIYRMRRKSVNKVNTKTTKPKSST
ncbi:hypothetical protein [Escherichia phage vB_EcoS_PHB17]|uniref:Uncharacterized protein n=1 Tax=Escherichia phage vB_EcoS_PHB17 TaxID=2591407 RepID=A0A514DKS7_9CAUD|nr:hypothetical protein KMB84_gp53 [Escherichia phage vB_EcoS_PHB17]QDH94256.1 hypothetical protein [Escherichia phage vB_EcoS_PHB17]